jgi:FdhD protein
MTPTVSNSHNNTGYTSVETQQWRNQELRLQWDNVVEEIPVALVFNGVSHAVMMTTPCDLEDFAIGFSITESIVEDLHQIYDLQLSEHEHGYEAALQISSQKMQALKQRKRNLTGNTGCGLCGVDSLAAAIRSGKKVKPAALPSSDAIQKAVESLSSWQRIQQQTGACHAAVWCNYLGDKVMLREDVGRHNALDKLVGAMVQAEISSDSGFVLISSRASYEMIHKASFLQCANLVAISAPTSLAISQAKQLNINLIGFARNGKHNLYTAPIIC